MEYHSVLERLYEAIKRYEGTLNILLSVRSQYERTIYWTNPTSWQSRKDKTMQTIKMMIGYRGWEVGQVIE